MAHKHEYFDHFKKDNNHYLKCTECDYTLLILLLPPVKFYTKQMKTIDEANYE